MTPHLAHLQLEEAPLLLHLLCDLGAADLRADHAVLSSMLLLLLLDLGAVQGEGGGRGDTSAFRGRPGGTGLFSQTHKVTEGQRSPGQRDREPTTGRGKDRDPKAGRSWANGLGPDTEAGK